MNPCFLSFILAILCRGFGTAQNHEADSSVVFVLPGERCIFSTTMGRSIEPYDPNTDFVEWVERLQQSFIASGTTDAAKQRAIFLVDIGPETYKLLKSLVSPHKPETLTLDVLVATLTKHKAPTPTRVVQRFRFNSCTREQNEDLSTFVARLRTLAEHCEFGETLNDMLCDRIVVGINNDKIQQRLLSEEKLDFDKAVAVGQAMLTAEKDIRDLQGQSVFEINEGEEDNVNKLGPGNGRKMSGRKFKGKTHHTPRPDEKCYRCLGGHKADECSFRKEICHHCKRRGHIKRACRLLRESGFQQGGTMEKTYLVEEECSSYVMHYTREDSEVHHMSGSSDPIMIDLQLEGQPVSMELDTGASVTILNNSTYDRIKSAVPSVNLKPTTKRLVTYTKEDIPIRGCVRLNVGYREQPVRTLSAVVVTGNGPNLLGRDWFKEIKLEWEAIHLAKEAEVMASVQKHRDLFKIEQGHYSNCKVKLHRNDQVQPRFFKARSVAFALQGPVDEELVRLEREGTVSRVDYSEWAAPIVPVLKANGQVRICGDYKLTANLAIKVDVHPIPKTEDMLAKLSGGQTFTKLDMSHAYSQLELDDESKDLTTINTPRGLYQYNRLPYGISAAPAIFQRVMDGLLAGLPGTVVFFDDILVTGKTESEHIENLERVLSKLQQAGLRLKLSKCEFNKEMIRYLGFIIDKNGLHTDDEKAESVLNAPEPSNVSELKSYLGMLNFYHKFLPSVADLLEPLHVLLRQDVEWKWEESQRSAFIASKQLLASAEVLTHFNNELPLVMSVDASPYGVGAVLAHVMPDGSERPIAYKSRSLNDAERGYAQVEKEGLAVIFGLNKFHKYLFGHKFKIYTDHKPLLGLFGEKKCVPQMAAARIQRWALRLSAYQYELKYRSGPKNTNADALSRLPVGCPPQKSDISFVPEEVINLIEHLDKTPTTAAQIKQWTNNDPVLSRVRTLVETGWPDHVSEDLRSYHNRSTELSVHDGCVLWGSRVVVPPQGRESVLQALHSAHPGGSRMKSFARCKVWWPGIDHDIELCTAKCSACQESRSRPAKVPLQPWEWPQKPWSRLHLDFAGPCLGGTYFLVIVDAHSKWQDIHIMNSITASATIDALRITFANHGLPIMLVSDNGSAFTSAEFQKFVEMNGIIHTTSAPYSPSSNGLAENAVKSLKSALYKMTGPVKTRLARYLLKQRTTPHSTTGVPPAELLMGRPLRTHLDLVKPDVSGRVISQQQTQKSNYDKGTHYRSFSPGEPVYARNFSQRGPQWFPGHILERDSSVTYLVKLADGRVIRRHINALFRAVAEQPVGGESSVPLQRHEPVPAPPVQVSLGLPASPIPVNEPLTHHSPTRVPDSASSSVTAPDPELPEQAPPHPTVPPIADRPREFTSSPRVPVSPAVSRMRPIREKHRPFRLIEHM